MKVIKPPTVAQSISLLVRNRLASSALTLAYSEPFKVFRIGSLPYPDGAAYGVATGTAVLVGSIPSHIAYHFSDFAGAALGFQNPLRWTPQSRTGV